MFCVRNTVIEEHYEGTVSRTNKKWRTDVKYPGGWGAFWGGCQRFVGERERKKGGKHIKSPQSKVYISTGAKKESKSWKGKKLRMKKKKNVIID